MPKIKPFSLSGMVDTDGEEDAANSDVFPTPDSNQENARTAKKKAPRQKATAKRFTRPKRLSGESVASATVAAPKSKPGRKKARVKDQLNPQNVDDTEGMDEVAAEELVKAQTKSRAPGKRKAIDDDKGDQLISAQPIIRREKAALKRKATDNQAGRPAKALAVEQPVTAKTDGEFEYTPTAERRGKLKSKPVTVKASAAGRALSTEPSQKMGIAETQAPMESDSSALQEEPEMDEDALSQSATRLSNNARQTSRNRQQVHARKRAGSASDAERAAGDPVLRRKLGDMTRKFEAVDLRYRKLRETRSTEAEANYEKLKKQSQANAKAADDLIVSLKKEIATQKAIAHESQSIRNQIGARDADLAKTQTLANQLSASLAETQNENRVLQTKLAQSRSASVAVESLGARTPGSAMKSKHQSQTRTLMVGSAEAAHAAQIAQLKEDLYSDLTGLILRSVNRGSDADTYDCIQTGRNGTLHFRLAIAKESDESYENTEFQYTPRLDDNRDKDLIALLPEYLTDDITFSRTNAAMFYGRVLETLTKRRTAAVDE